MLIITLKIDVEENLKEQLLKSLSCWLTRMAATYSAKIEVEEVK